MKTKDTDLGAKKVVFWVVVLILFGVLNSLITDPYNTSSLSRKVTIGVLSVLGFIYIWFSMSRLYKSKEYNLLMSLLSSFGVIIAGLIVWAIIGIMQFVSQ